MSDKHILIIAFIIRNACKLFIRGIIASADGMVTFASVVLVGILIFFPSQYTGSALMIPWIILLLIILLFSCIGGSLSIILSFVACFVKNKKRLYKLSFIIGVIGLICEILMYWFVFSVNYNGGVVFYSFIIHAISVGNLVYVKKRILKDQKGTSSDLPYL